MIIPAFTREPDGSLAKTRENAAAALRMNANMVRTGDQDIAADAKHNAVLLAIASRNLGWLNSEDVLASLMTGRDEEQRVGSREANARHIERIADMVEHTTSTSPSQLAAQRLFADPQPHRFAKEIM